MLPLSLPFCSKSLAVCCVLFHVDYYILPEISKKIQLKYLVKNPFFGSFCDSIEVVPNQIFMSIESSFDEKIFAESYLDSFLIQFLTIILETTSAALSIVVS